MSGAVVEWLGRLDYGAESRRRVVSSRLGFAIRRLENSVNQALNGYLFRIREGWDSDRRGISSAFHLLCRSNSGILTPLPLWLLGYGKPLPLPFSQWVQEVAPLWANSQRSEFFPLIVDHFLEDLSAHNSVLCHFNWIVSPKHKTLDLQLKTKVFFSCACNMPFVFISNWNEMIASRKFRPNSFDFLCLPVLRRYFESFS